jgi:hypothetical protein
MDICPKSENIYHFLTLKVCQDILDMRAECCRLAVIIS